MKCYVEEKQWRMAGKAWEIREYLKKQVRANNEETLLADFLRKRSVQPGKMTKLRQIVV